MPSAITRYILAELVRWFVLAIVLLSLLLVVIFVGQEAWRMNLGLVPTLRLIPFILPTALVFAVPGAILFTVCLVYGRVSADNEVIATKAAGISPLALLWPAFGFAFLLSVVAVWLNDVAFSWGQVGVQRVVLQSVEEIAYGMLRAQGSFANPRFSIVVKGVEGRRLLRPTMNFQPNNDMPAFALTAVEAELRSNFEDNTLILVLKDTEIETSDGLRSVLPGVFEQPIPLRYASLKEMKENSPTHIPLRRIDPETLKQEEIVECLEQALAADVAMALITGDLHTLGESQWRPRRRELADAKARLYKLKTEKVRRWASGFSCLCFVLVGAPLAILWRRADFMTTFAVCFIPILLIYYPLFMFGLDRSKAGALPPYTVWAANILLLFLGLWLLRRVIRY